MELSQEQFAAIERNLKRAKKLAERYKNLIAILHTKGILDQEEVNTLSEEVGGGPGE